MEVEYYTGPYPPGGLLNMHVTILESLTQERLDEISNLMKAIHSQVRSIIIELSVPHATVSPNLNMHEFGETLRYCNIGSLELPFDEDDYRIKILLRRLHTGNVSMLVCLNGELVYLRDYEDVNLCLLLVWAAKFHKDQFPLPVELIRVLRDYLYGGT